MRTHRHSVKMNIINISERENSNLVLLLIYVNLLYTYYIVLSYTKIRPLIKGKGQIMKTLKNKVLKLIYI